MKNAGNRFKVVSLLLFMSAVICLFLSIFLESEGSSVIFRRIGLLLLAVMILQTAFFKISPESYKNKK